MAIINKMTIIDFKPRWREELVARSSEGILIFELTMGQYHVYFPTLERWESTVPAWAKGKWQVYQDQCALWCKGNRIPLTITDDAYVYEEKPAAT